MHTEQTTSLCIDQASFQFSVGTALNFFFQLPVDLLLPLL
nr:MAG TPA: hypothetical protein [Caudoviricetes sp.]